MQLLSKLEIDQAKSLERKLEIDEGRKLASKVDDLRRLSASEEASLTNVIRAYRATVNDEIQELIAKRHQYDSEAQVAKSQRDAMLAPINDRAAEFEETEKRLDKKAASIDERENTIAARETAVFVREQEAKRIMEDAVREKQRAAVAIAEAAQRDKESRETSRAANKELDAARKIYSTITEELNAKREAADAREAVLDAQSDAQAEEAKKLSAWERDLIDREGVLERELKRIEK